MKKHEIITVGIDELYANDYNSNKMPEIKFEALVDTIRRNGQTQPIQIVAGEKGKYRIVGGEHKWRAMKVLKYKQCEVIVRSFDDEVDEQLGSIEDNLRGNPIPIKEAVIIASATKKYRMSDLQKRLGATEPEIKDRLFLLGESAKIEKMKETLEKEHTVELDFIIDADAKDNAERFAKEIETFAKQIGASDVKTTIKISKTKEAVALLTFNVSDLQKKVIEQAISHIVKTEDVTKGRALEFLSAEYLAGAVDKKPAKKKK